MKKIRLQTGFLIVLIFVVALSRLLPHMANLSPLAAIGLFGAAHFYKKWQAFLIPVAAIWISDVFLNNTLFSQYHNGFVWFYEGFYWQYASYFLIILIGLFLYKKNISFLKILGGVGIASILFFIVSNFGVWASYGMYPKSVEGLAACYIAALPFLKGTIIGDLLFTLLLFGGYYLLQKRFLFFRLAYQKYVYTKQHSK